MEWSALSCASADLLGEREGHCSAILTSDIGNLNCVVVVGGYGEGEVPSTVIASPVSIELDAAALQWQHVADDDIFAKDGATLTSVTPSLAFLFGGLNSSTERTNQAALVSIHGSAENLSLKWKEIQLAGDVPSSRFRHSAVRGNSSIFIFGGDTNEDGNASNELYCIQLETFQCTRVATTGSSAPRPRFASAMVYTRCLRRDLLILFGGAFFEARGKQTSWSDMYAFDIASSTFTELVLPNDAKLPRCNGHVGFSFTPAESDDGVVGFFGGKDFDEGSDLIIRVVNGTRVEVLPPVDGAPHWTYGASCVMLAGSMLVLAGQCRHPSSNSTYRLCW